MSDHYHYDYASTNHDHRGQYADDRHDHGLDYAEKHHRHYDDESTARGLREDLSRAEERIRELEDGLRDVLGRITALEGQRPQARQLQLEADLAAADLAESGYDRHGRHCQCPYCLVEPEEEPPAVEYDPGPEFDDEGGMSEYRYILGEDYQRGQS
jgi:hypothetical protein